MEAEAKSNCECWEVCAERLKVVVVGVGMERYNNKSMAELLDPVETSVDKSGIPMGVIEGIRKISDAELMKKRSK